MEVDRETESHGLPPHTLIVLFLLALVPRMAGLITFENSDEGWGAAARVLTGDFSGGTSQTLPLINYLIATSFVVLFALGRLVGVWHGTADFRAQYFIDRTPFVFSGRLVAACFGALSAPLAAMIARLLGLSQRSSLIVGVLVAILPASVLQSHIAKPDSGVAFGTLFFTWAILRMLDKPSAKGADVLVGIAIAIAVSFKQTAVFLVAPAVIGFVALLRWDCGLSWSRIARAALVSFLACVLAWMPMNLGVLLDLRGFLDYQRATAVMMSRDATAYQIAQHVIGLLAGTITGVTAAGLLAWVLAPFIRRDGRFLNLWIATLFAYLTFSAISGGGENHPALLASLYALGFPLGCIAALSLTEKNGFARTFGVLLTLTIVVLEGIGFIDVVRQAMATPMPVRCSEVLKIDRRPRSRQDPHGVPLPDGTADRPAAIEEEQNRHERLAKKYGVALTERAEESRSHRYQTGKAYYVRNIPFPMGGMEDLKAEVAQKAVKPYWWPIQPEEWNLDYWIKQGYNIFVVQDESVMENSSIPEYRSLHQEIKQRCEQVAVVPSRRPLFFEGEMKIYRLRNPSGSAPSSGPGSR